jgi:molecular chaperone GrpE (heat shock protein)
VRGTPESTVKVEDGEGEGVKGAEVKPGTIMDTFKVGYRIKDRCLRASQVGVVGE